MLSNKVRTTLINELANFVLYSNQQMPIICQTFSMIDHIDEKRLHDQVNKRKDKHKDKDARSREARELS